MKKIILIALLLAAVTFTVKAEIPGIVLYGNAGDHCGRDC